MASAEYSVLTPERVSLQYDIAGIGSRGAATLIDTAIQVVLLIVVAMALSATALAGSAMNLDAGIDPTGAVIFVGAVYVLAVFLVTAGYYMLFEVIWNGQTPGKRTLGVRVIRENGYPIRPVDAVIRNLVRIVDWLPASYAIGVVTMLLNKRSKRLGDFAAGTIVVREAAARPEFLAPPRPDAVVARGPESVFAPSPESVPPSSSASRTESAVPSRPESAFAPRPESVPPAAASGVARSAQPAAPDPHGYSLTRSDATLVRDFLTRRAAMDPIARAELARRLAAALASRYGLVRDADPEAFLERLDA